MENEILINPDPENIKIIEESLSTLVIVNNKINIEEATLYLNKFLDTKGGYERVNVRSLLCDYEDPYYSANRAYTYFVNIDRGPFTVGQYAELASMGTDSYFIKDVAQFIYDNVEKELKNYVRK